MELEERLHELNELGATYIHDKTHIALSSIEPILTLNFTAISPVQFAGFFNIIENELHMDMNPLREALKEHIQQHNLNKDKDQLFIYAKSEQTSNTLMYSIVSIVLLAVVLLYIFSKDHAEKPTQETSSTAIVQASQAIETSAPNTKQVTNETIEKPAIATASSIAHFDAKQANSDSLEANHPFLLYPKEDLWIGIIDLDTKEKKDTITNKPYALDENKNLLISLGHGEVKVVLNGETIDSNSHKRLRYLYKDGKLRTILLDEFKELNDGKSW